MKIVIINRSDHTGGAAVVSFRLMNALRDAGADARMLVVEKLSDSPYVEICAPADKARIPFLKERLKIFANNKRNGFCTHFFFSFCCFYVFSFNTVM